MIAHFFSGITLLTFIVSCKAIRNGSENSYQKINGTAQGTTYNITFKSTKANYKIAVDSIFKVIDHSMSLWDKNSIISNINKPSSEPIEVDEHLKVVFQKATEVYQKSLGTFDPTAGVLIKSWGFIYKNNLPLPTPKTIDSLKQYVGFDKVTILNNKVAKSNPNMQLDFNGIAQGYTIDVLADFFEKQGVLHYLIEVGGELRAKGKNNKGKSWNVGIEKPIYNETEAQNDLQSILKISDMSLSTSGNYRNFIVNDDQYLSHILNPKTGKPVEHRVLSVSVLAPTCMEADAWATAFIVLGKEKSLELAMKYGLEIQLVLLADKNFEVVQTEGFKKANQVNYPKIFVNKM